MCLTNFGKFLAIISSNISFVHSFSFSLFWILNTHILNIVYLIMSHISQILKSVCFLFVFFFTLPLCSYSSSRCNAAASIYFCPSTRGRISPFFFLFPYPSFCEFPPSSETIVLLSFLPKIFFLREEREVEF